MSIVLTILCAVLAMFLLAFAMTMVEEKWPRSYRFVEDVKLLLVIPAGLVTVVLFALAAVSAVVLVLVFAAAFTLFSSFENLISAISLRISRNTLKKQMRRLHDHPVSE